jgi:cytochrome c553
VLPVLAGLVLYPIGMKKLHQTYPNLTVETLTIPTDAQAVARGRHIATIWACTRCHDDNLGGSLITQDPIEGYVPLFGTIPAANLTSGKGGIAQSYTDADWVRAIRHGVKPNGHSEIFMYDDSTMSDRDLGDLLAYLKQLPPVDSAQPALRYGPLLPILPALGLFTPAAETIDHNAPHPAAAVAGATKEYGKYLSALCAGCHDAGMVGPVRGKYAQADLPRAIRTGVLPNGTPIGRAMPPSIFGAMTDTELTALWLYLQNRSSS